MSDYINWHYFQVWPKIVLLWRNLSLYPYYYFSVSSHLQHLFAPWKRQTVTMRPGFHLDDMVGVVSFNITSRIIGAIVKLAVIFSALVFSLFFFLLGFALTVLWVAAIGLSLPAYLSRKLNPAENVLEVLKISGQKKELLAVNFLNSPHGKFVMQRLNLNPKTYENIKNKYLKQEKTEISVNVSVDENNLTESIKKFYQLICKTSVLSALLAEKSLACDDFYQVAKWYKRLYDQKDTSIYFNLSRIKNLPGVGSDWSYGYTVEFDKYARDATAKPSPYPYLLGRDKEIKAIERILLKGENNNCLIVGEPGTARHILVQTLAHRLKSGKCEQGLSHKRILSLDMHALSQDRESVINIKALLSQILTEADSAGNVIVEIDEIHRYLSTGGEGIDLSDVFEKFSQGPVALIGITTTDGYQNFIQQNSTLNKLFEAVTLDPPDRNTVLLELMLSIVPVLEQKHHVVITYQALLKTVDDADRFITSMPFPGKAIELLEETIIYTTSQKKQHLITDAVVDEFLSKKLHMPIGKLIGGEKEKLVHLEEVMHQRLINQHEAIRVIASALRRSRLNISSTTKPIGSFLFLGPTGVGKTETAKTLSAIYFENEDKILRFDMSQYKGEEGLERLVGSIKLQRAGEMTSRLASNPYSVILLDEIEKSDTAIYNLFLTLFDEGYISDVNGKHIDAKNSIVIATSNAGAEYIRECLNEGMDSPALQKSLIEYVQREKIFSPEFINRFDAVVVFTPLSEGNLKEVAKLMLNKLNARLTGQGLRVKITPQLIDHLVATGFDRSFGGRAMRREIENKVEDQVAKLLLQGKPDKEKEIVINL